MGRAHRLLLIVGAIVSASGCFATRSDVQVLQGDIAVLRAEAVRADSAHRDQMRQIARQIGAVGDTLRSVNAFLARFQGDFSLTMHTFGQQLLAVQELTGQSQKKLQEMRASLEAAQQERATQVVVPAAPVASVPGAPTAAPVASAAVQPPVIGPNQLFQVAKEQLQAGRTSAARDGFQTFLAQYPSDDLASDAAYRIAESWALEGKLAAADTAYQLVADKYPKSEQAPRAIYKRAMTSRQAGQTRQARTLFQLIVDKYPKSLEAELAADFLKTLK